MLSRHVGGGTIANDVPAVTRMVNFISITIGLQQAMLYNSTVCFIFNDSISPCFNYKVRLPGALLGLVIEPVMRW